MPLVRRQSSVSGRLGGLEIAGGEEKKASADMTSEVTEQLQVAVTLAFFLIILK